MKTLSPLYIVLILLISLESSAQIVTSKKEAQRRGIYEYSNSEQFRAGAANGGVAMLDNSDKDKKKKSKEKKASAKNKGEINYKNISDDYEVENFNAVDYLAEQIVNNAMEFDGVRYRGGGTTKDGMDCSGLVVTTFKIFDILLPRSSHEQAKVGKKIARSDVKKGDLIFFKNNRRRNIINHVGLVTEVLGDEVKFIHSSLQKGVIISSTKEPYYERTFVQFNRILE